MCFLNSFALVQRFSLIVVVIISIKTSTGISRDAVRNMKMHIFIIFIQLGVTYKVTSEIILPQNETDYNVRSLVKCIVSVSKNVILPKSLPTIVIYDKNDEVSIAKERFMTEFMRTLIDGGVPQIVTDNLKKFNQEVIAYDGNSIIVIYFENYASIENFNFEEIVEKNKYVFFIDNNIKIEDLKSLRKYIEYLDVTIFIFKPEISGHILLTFIPKINPDNCKDHNNIEPTTLGNCIFGLLDENVVFPFPDKKSSNYMKCPLNVGIQAIYPFFHTKNTEIFKALDPVDEARGLDIEILKIISQRLNTTLHFYYVVRETSVSNFFYFLNYLHNGTLDICAGGIYRKYADNVTYYSGPYLRQDVIFIYSAQRPLKSFLNFYAKWDVVLLVFGIYFLIYSIAWYCFRQFDKRPTSFEHTLVHFWGALLGSNRLLHATSVKQKMLNVFYLYLCMNLSIYMNIYMYAYMTLDDPPKIYKTYNEILESGKKAYLLEQTKKIIPDDQFLAFTSSSELCEDFDDCKDKILKNEGITIVTNLIFYKIQLTTTVDHEARILRVPDNLLTMYHYMTMRKSLPMLKKIQEITVRLKEAGIIDWLCSNEMGLTTMHKTITSTASISKVGHKCQRGCAMSMYHIIGLLCLWSFGCILSCCVFVVELVLRREYNLLAIRNRKRQ